MTEPEPDLETLRRVYNVAKRWCTRPESVLSEERGCLKNDIEMWKKLRAAVGVKP